MVAVLRFETIEIFRGSEVAVQSRAKRLCAHEKMAAISGGHLKIDHRVEEKHRPISVLGRPGSDLLFQALRLSTIGAGEFNGRVRDGIGFSLSAKTTRPAKDGDQRSEIMHQESR
jgi:hypothetical protein